MGREALWGGLHALIFEKFRALQKCEIRVSFSEPLCTSDPYAECSSDNNATGEQGTVHENINTKPAENHCPNSDHR